MTIMEFIKKEEKRRSDLCSNSKRLMDYAADFQDAEDFRFWDKMHKDDLTKWAVLYDLIFQIEKEKLDKNAIPVEWLLAHQSIDGNDNILELIKWWREENE